MTEQNSKVLACRNCGQQFRIPTDRGKLLVTCPKCRHEWDWPASLLPRFMNRRTMITGGLLGLGLSATAAVLWRKWSQEDQQDDPPAPETSHPVLTSYQDLMGCRFTEVDQAPLGPVTVRAIPLPDFPGAFASWGATGRDSSGHIWVGVSAEGVPEPSAHLFEYDPEADVLQDRGDVVGELRRANLLRPGEGQMKIHSRIVQGEDGHLYFASMDEQGERSDGSRLPRWGSHLWRLRLPERQWEHLLAVPEALIAVAASGQWIVALGYFNHVVYVYDCRSGASRSMVVGSLGGHISRNFFCDFQGHIYVPRLKPDAQGMLSTLVELDPQLREWTETPLNYYTQSRDEDSHGMVGFQPLADKSIVFATDQGWLYHVIPMEGWRARVRDLGWFHPGGRAYVASMFTSDGRRHIMGLMFSSQTRQLEWVVFDLTTLTKVVVPVPMPTLAGQPVPDALVYGSITRDNAGRCYAAGMTKIQGRAYPLFLQVRQQG
jgi:hypothetical protein